MAATIKLPWFRDGIEATISGYVWTSDTPKVARILNNLLPPDGAEASDPNPDYTVAQDVVNQFGGKILSFDKSKFDKRVVY